MQQARAFSVAVSLVALLYGAVGYALLPQAAFEGDLTRMAMLPEQLFGWTRPQPAVAQGEVRQHSLAQADVLVIGDSFSTPLIWQISLHREGWKVRTEHWDNLRGVCADLGAFLTSQGFRGQRVVLQVVERNLERVLDESLRCASTRYRLKQQVDASPGVPATSHDRQHPHRDGRMSVGIRSQVNGWRHQWWTAATDLRSWQVTANVRVTKVEGGCAKFSHPACRDALFFAEDAATDLPLDEVRRMADVAERLKPWKVTWVVVPNKSTVYLHPDKQFWQVAQARLGAPDLLRMTQHALEIGHVDLYPGNNTHFSTEGYQLMGELVRGAMLTQP